MLAAIQSSNTTPPAIASRGEWSAAPGIVSAAAAAIAAEAAWAHAMSPPPAPAPLPDADPARVPALHDLEAIFCQHQTRLLQAAYRITGNRDDAEDVLQTVFLRLARDGGELRLRPGAELGGYLHRMAVHSAIDLLRRRRPQAAEGAVDRMTAATPSPERAHRGLEMQALLRQAVAALGGRAAEIFVLRYWEELDNTEIARRLGIPRVTVAVTLHRARRQLRQTLRRHWGEQR